MVYAVQSGLNGADNDHIAINDALISGRTILLEGDYHVSDKILVPYSGVQGSGRCIISNGARIYGDAANKTILHWADCWGEIIGHLTLAANNQGLHLMHLTPELEENNTAPTNQNYNYFQHINFFGGDEQLVVMTGKPINGVDSGCWYNRFGGIKATSGKRAIWIKDNGFNGVSDGSSGSGSNSNAFDDVVINGSCNTGIQIDAGGGNLFKNLNMENIQLGNSPNTTPTGIVVKDNMLNGGANPHNEFHVHFENVTRHAQIENKTTKIFGDIDWNLVTGGAGDGLTSSGGHKGFYASQLTAEAGGGFNLSYNRIGWVKHGQTVTVSGLIVVGSKYQNPTGRAYIKLPFPIAGAVGNQYQNRIAVSLACNLLATSGVPVQARVLEGTNLIELGLEGSWGAFAELIPVGADFTFNATYLTN